jgi:ABC-2 type transport system ATP-binding protein
MIELQNVRKVYGEIEALRGISTTIEGGEIVGLLGPNGAGKTTTMKILVGYLLPTSGTARVAGLDVVEQPLEVQRRIGYLPESAPLYEDMLVQDYLRFMAEMRGLKADAARRNIHKAVDECAIGSVLVRPIGQLSKGFRQRVGLAASILHEPDILILDEPTTGLDPNQIVEVRELIRQMGRTKTIILSTHILPEVEATCDRAVILIDGRIRADGRLSELTGSRTQIVVAAPEDAARAGTLLESLAGVQAVGIERGTDRFHTFRLTLADDRELGEAVAELARREGWPLRELRRDETTLEQVFRELTESNAEVAA